MAELAGKLACVKVSGSAVPFVGEVTTGTGNTVYQITDTIKQVLDRTATIQVHLYDSASAAELGTNTTNIKITAHGLSEGDLIVNTTRSNAARLVAAVVDVDNITVAAVTDQTDGDTIALYPTEVSSAYTLNRLNGTVTYGAALARTIRISGSYLPMSTAAYAHAYTYQRGADIQEVNRFLAVVKHRISGLKWASGTLNQWDLTDLYFADALTAGDPVVLEFLSDSGVSPRRLWALFEQSEISAAVDSPQDEVVSFISTDTLLDI